MESKATELLAVLKSTNATIETKVATLTGIKSDIKQRNVPEGAIIPIFEALRLAIAAQHSSLSAAGFSAFGHLLKRLYIQEHHHAVAAQARHLYPLLVERLGDHKDRVRAQAAQAFTDLWPAASAEVEHHVLEVALVAKNPRAKEMSMLWLSNVS
jgi:CLIP-associating protein 1/2